MRRMAMALLAVGCLALAAGEAVGEEGVGGLAGGVKDGRKGGVGGGRGRGRRGGRCGKHSHGGAVAKVGIGRRSAYRRSIRSAARSSHWGGAPSRPQPKRPCGVATSHWLSSQATKPSGPRDGLESAFQRVLQRSPTDAETAVLLPLYEKHRAAYESDPASAAALLKVGESPLPDGIAVVDLAAWSSVCRAMLNLHETITRY